MALLAPWRLTLLEQLVGVVNEQVRDERYSHRRFAAPA